MKNIPPFMPTVPNGSTFIGMKPKILFFFSVCSSAFFIIMALDSRVYKWDFVWLGVIRELITFPLIMFQFAFLFWSINELFKSSLAFRSWLFWVFVITLINCSVITYSFLS